MRNGDKTVISGAGRNKILPPLRSETDAEAVKCPEPRMTRKHCQHFSGFWKVEFWKGSQYIFRTDTTRQLQMIILCEWKKQEYWVPGIITTGFWKGY
ncbi:hypothetical protein AVEN_63269-1 [Araneus ventricosus]|uniref:Uncharacterized protein n=1 Tax=Araneus ventricosus TaxID=182803 RepID=A0A4Y2K298_ARAVE|nr:hypothetical protein AVEN_63269-1 [Araneus ventricosus]